MTEIEPGVWASDPLELHEGEMLKLRFGGSWDQNYGIDPEWDGSGPVTYCANGSNLVIPADETYIITLDLSALVTITLTNSAGETITPLTEGDSPAPFDPFPHTWTVIGTIFGTEWDTDFLMTETEPGVWQSAPWALHAGEEFRVRANCDSECGNYGTESGDNCVVGEDGTYIITLNLNNDPVAVTWELTDQDPVEPEPVTPLGEEVWTVIGTIFGTEWDTDFTMTEIEPGVWASEPLDLHINDELKVRFGGSWNQNYGIDPDWDGSGPVTYRADGWNLVIPFTDTYIITLYLSDPVTITLTNSAGETVMPLTEGGTPDPPDPFSHTPSVIGSIYGTMWDTDFWMTEIETDVWASEPLDLHINDELKVRFGGTWDTNYGIDPDWDGNGPVTYSPDGRNLVIPFTDTYIITLDLSALVTITLTNAAGETVMPGAEPFDDPDPGDDPGNDPDYPYISDEDIDPATAFNFASDDLEVPDTPPVAPDYDNSLSDLPIDEAHFPDANFREWILRTLDYETSADEETGEESYFFTGEQRWNVTVIDCRGRHIQSLAGIEYFPNLEWLFCGRMLTEYVPEYAFMLYASNPITSLDVSGNPKLKLLFANYCKLESIDLSQNPALTHLNLFYNELTELDLSNNPLLEALAFDVNDISSFDPSVLPNLRILRCGFTALTALDLSGRSELTELRCHNNDMLETLNINGCANLIPTESSIHDCYALKELRMRNCNLREIPINIDNLEILDCGNNTQFTSLDLSDYRELRELYCDNCNLYRLELSMNRKITILNCSYNHLKELQFVLIPGSTPEYGGDFSGTGQTAVCASGMEPEDDAYTFDMANLVASENLGRILSVNGATYDPATGIATFAEAAETLIYSYETQPSGVQYISVPLIVTVSLNVEMPDLPDGAIPIDAEHFPDANFRAWILKTLTPYYTEDAFGRKYLTDTRYDAFYFSMDGWGVASLEGLQYFPNAHSLMCGGGSLQDEDGE